MQDTTNELRLSVQTLSGMTPDRLEGLQRLEIQTVADLIKHLPLRFEEHHGGVTIEEATAILGEDDRNADLVTIEGEVASVRPIRGWKQSKARVEISLEDETASLKINWFNQPWIAKKLHPEMHIRVHGSLSKYKGEVQMTNPRWEEIEPDENSVTIDGGLRPVYPANEYISSSTIATLIGEVIGVALPQIEDHFSVDECKRLEMPELREAYRMVHNPQSESESKEGRRRIAYDELFLLQLGVMLKRHHRQTTLHAPALRNHWKVVVENHVGWIRGTQHFESTRVDGRLCTETLVVVSVDGSTLASQPEVKVEWEAH